MDFWQMLEGLLRGMIVGNQPTASGLPAAQVTGGMDIGATGYSTEADRVAKIAKLSEACEFAVNNPAWSPRDGVTYCNRAANYIAQAMGYYHFVSNPLANQMIAHMENCAEWQAEHDLDRVSRYAMAGALVFCCVQENPHGHIAAAYPIEPELSGSWGGRVPRIANVGVKNGVMRLSEAFRAELRPRMRYFLLRSSLA